MREVSAAQAILPLLACSQLRGVRADKLQSKCAVCPHLRTTLW